MVDALSSLMLSDSRFFPFPAAKKKKVYEISLLDIPPSKNGYEFREKWKYIALCTHGRRFKFFDAVR